MTDKELWFKNQCEAEGISAEDIMVFGEYATNKDGDFLYSVKHEDGSYTMNCVAACDLMDCESTYPEWLLGLMENMEEGYREGDEILQSRTWWDRKDIALCFKEAMCRNQEFQESWREELRKKPAMGVYQPGEVSQEHDVYYGLRDVENEQSGMPVDYVLQPDELKAIEGYRFATKVANVAEFVETYGNIQWEGQHGPFRVLADLEEAVSKAWKEEGKIMAEHWLFNTDEGCGPGHGADMVGFAFSHFEVENEPDERYRTIFVVYSERFDV